MIVPLWDVGDVARVMAVSQPTADWVLKRGLIHGVLRVYGEGHGDRGCVRVTRTAVENYINQSLGNETGTPVTTLLGSKEVAVMLNLSERTVLRLFAAGAIRAFRIGAGQNCRGKLWRTTIEIVSRSPLRATMPLPKAA